MKSWRIRSVAMIYLPFFFIQAISLLAPIKVAIILVLVRMFLTKTIWRWSLWKLIWIEISLGLRHHLIELLLSLRSEKLRFSWSFVIRWWIYICSVDFLVQSLFYSFDKLCYQALQQTLFFLEHSFQEFLAFYGTKLLTTLIILALLTITTIQRLLRTYCVFKWKLYSFDVNRVDLANQFLLIALKTI